METDGLEEEEEARFTHLNKLTVVSDHDRSPDQSDAEASDEEDEETKAYAEGPVGKELIGRRSYKIRHNSGH